MPKTTNARQSDGTDAAAEARVTFTALSIHGQTTDLSDPDRVMVSGVILTATGIRDMFNQMLQSAAERALDEHGMGAFGAPKFAAAAHEAGHAVVGATLGYAITTVKLIKMRPDADIWGGVTNHIGEPAPGTPMVGRVVVLRQARMLFAGLAAESRLRDFRRASSLDELVMSQMLAATIAESDESPEALWRECVERDVDRRIASNYASLQAAAQALCDKGRLRGSRLRKILAAVAVDDEGTMPRGRDELATLRRSIVRAESKTGTSRKAGAGFRVGVDKMTVPSLGPARPEV